MTADFTIHNIGLILLLFVNYYFTLVEENFEMWHSEMLQIGLILLLFDNHYFTLVEENFEMWHSETLQDGVIPLINFKFDLAISEL